MGVLEAYGCDEKPIFSSLHGHTIVDQTFLFMSLQPAER